MRNRAEFIRAVLLLCLVWVLITIGLAAWQRRSQPLGPPLLHYPGTESVTEQTVPTLASRKYWFQLREDYPSLSVFTFYQQALAARGWHSTWTVTPTWQRVPGEGQANDVFEAAWISPDRVYQLQLQMVSTVTVTKAGESTTEVRQPGIKVYVTQMQSVGPWLLEQKPKEQRPSIDVKGKGD